MNNALVTVIGGSGFLGKYVVQQLIAQGYRVQVIARNASRARHLMPIGAQAPVSLRNGDVTRPKSLQGALKGSFAVVNLTGILFEKKRQRFTSLHAQCPERLAQQAKEEGVEHFVHVSAIGASDASDSNYARTKATGEKAVLSVLPHAVILRPSVIFGAEDNFFNQFAQMAVVSPVLPLISGGETRFQPVYVMDVAKAIVAGVQGKLEGGKAHELGGPKSYSFRELLQIVMRETGKKRLLLPIPTFLAKIIGFFGEFAPKPPLTRDQVSALQYDNLVDPELDGFFALDMQPTPLELIVPQYLSHFRRQLPPELKEAKA